MDLRVLMVTKNPYFLLFTHTKQLLSVTLCDTTAGIGNSKVGHHCHRMEGGDSLKLHSQDIPIYVSVEI